MGCGGSAVMDLEPIEERANEFATWVGKFDSEHRIPAAFASAADVPALLAEVKRLRADVARLTARPAPAWDEEAVQAEVLGIDARHHFHGTACLCGFDSHGRARSATEHITSAVLAVVRDYLPVKPSREAVIEAMLGSDIITDDLRAEASAQGTTQREPFLCFADAVLDLLHGRSEAEALRDFAARVRDEMDDSDKVLGTKWATDEYRHGMRSALMQVDEEADRLAAEGGADRG